MKRIRSVLRGREGMTLVGMPMRSTAEGAITRLVHSVQT